MGSNGDDDNGRSLAWNGNERRQHPPAHEIYRYVDEHLARATTERFKVRTFADLQALITIGVVMIGGIAWGLKLETRLETEAKAREALTAVVAKGILPVTEERMISLTNRLDRREAEANQAMEMIREIERECNERLGRVSR